MDSKKFGKLLLKFWNKRKTANTVILVENDKILQDDKAFIKYLTNQFRWHRGDGGASYPTICRSKKKFLWVKSEKTKGRE